MTVRRWPRRLFAAAMVIAALAGGLAIGELALRRKEHLKSGQRAIRTRDRYLHHNLKPLVEGRPNWYGRVNHYWTNDLAYRDAAARTIEKKPVGRKRLLVLGDSFVEGLGVEYEETFTARLESTLRVEVLNAGVVSYSPFLEARKLEQFLAAGYTTDGVVLFFDISDLQDEGYEDEYARLQGDETFGFSPKDWLEDLELVRLFRKRLGNAENKRLFDERGRWTEDPAIFDRWGKRGMERCLHSIAKISDLLRARGIPFHVVIYPWPTQLESTRVPSLAETLVGSFAAEHGIQLINLYPAFRALPNWHEAFIPDDCHWTDKGHDLVARELARVPLF